MIKTKRYYGFPGHTVITDAELTNVKIMQVTRSGLDYTVSESLSASGQRVYHDKVNGKVYWESTFNGWVYPERPNIAALEKVSVKFKL